MTEKRLIVTRADENLGQMSSLTHPVFREYAQRCGADFEVLSEDYPCEDRLGKCHYRIMTLFDLFEDYNRILCVDTDVLLSPECPDVFDMVPAGEWASVFEDRGSRAQDRVERIDKVQKEWGDVGWEVGYINTGFVLFSENQRDAFQKNDGKLWLDRGYDDVHLGYMLNKLGQFQTDPEWTFYEFPYTYNHQSMFSEPWNGSPDRRDSYVIHYSGGAKFPGSGWSSLDWNDPAVREKHRLGLIREDYNRWYGD